MAVSPIEVETLLINDVTDDDEATSIADKSYLRISPDGLVLCTSVDTLCNGCLEIKCPYSIDVSVNIELSPQCIAEKFGDKFFMK